MLFADVAKRMKGRKNCERCDGKGVYKFHDSWIFCESCHSEETITNTWGSINSAITWTEEVTHKRRKTNWPTDAEYLGFADARRMAAPSTWTKVSDIKP